MPASDPKPSTLRGSIPLGSANDFNGLKEILGQPGSADLESTKNRECA